MRTRLLRSKHWFIAAACWMVAAACCVGVVSPDKWAW
jgi:hypothetical protein